MIDELGSTPNALERDFAEIPVEARAWEPESWEGFPGETFSAAGQVCHVRDIEIDGYHVRIERLLRENRPLLISIDSYALARERRYGEQDPVAALAAFRAARARTVAMLQGLSESDWSRRGHFEGYGPVTLKGLVHVLRSHDQQHLACMQWLLGRIRSL